MKYHINLGKRSASALTERFPVVGECSDFRIAEATDGQLDAVRTILQKETGRNELRVSMVGEDHRPYLLTEDRVVLATKYEKWPFTEREWEEYFQKQDRQAAKERHKRDALLAKHRGDAREERGSPLSYKPGYYVTKTHGLWFPYRVKYAKKPGQPLLVFFHGGGSVGTDNLRPLYEYKDGPYPEWFPWRKRAPLYKSDMTVLIPQSSQSGAYQYHDYIAAVKDLCEQIAEEAQTDMTRIYCMGGSWGGAGTWLSAYLFPDFYACAMPMMGELYHPDMPWPPTPETLSHMKALPIWVSHSADDTVVSIDRDDATVAVLRELGAPVKYTRVNGKGHHYLVPYFLKTELWAEWMFAQSKKKQQEEEKQ